jgi:hypothetical protein
LFGFATSSNVEADAAARSGVKSNLKSNRTKSQDNRSRIYAKVARKAQDWNLTMAIEPKEIGLLWALHYPSRRRDKLCHEICVSLCSLLRELAFQQMGGDFTAKLARVLHEADVPLEQFEECEAGSK